MALPPADLVYTFPETYYLTRDGIVVTRYEPNPVYGAWTWQQHQTMWDIWPSRYERVPYAERVQRCEEMGLFVCSCRGVAECAPEGHRGLIIDPRCKVHRIVYDVPLW